MLYSESKNFAFLHIPKTGGTSALKYLRTAISDLECIGMHHSGIDDLPDLSLQKNCPCGLINSDRKILPEVKIDSTIFLSIVRDPFEIWQSHYYWAVQKMKIYKQSRFPELFNLLYQLRKTSKRAYLNFNDFLHNGKKLNPTSNRYFNDHLGKTLEQRLSLNSKFPAKLYLIKNENMNTQLSFFLKEILQLSPLDYPVSVSNRSDYSKAMGKAPESFMQSERFYYSGAINGYLFKPSETIVPEKA
jgi:hypothetical protein